jgi:hypothetical protein
MIQRMMSLLRLFSSAMQGSTTHLKSQFKCQLNSSAAAYGFDGSMGLAVPEFNNFAIWIAGIDWRKRAIHWRLLRGHVLESRSRSYVSLSQAAEI